MGIRMTNGRVYAGATALDIVNAMRDSPWAEGRSVGAYIGLACANAQRMLGLDLRVAGDNDAERAASFVAAVLAQGLARPL